MGRIRFCCDIEIEEQELVEAGIPREEAHSAALWRFAFSRIIQSWLFGVQTSDLLTFVLVPARRATNVDPLAALRCD